MQPPPPDMNYGYGQPKKSSTNWIWIVIAVLAICGCGAVVLLPAVLFPVFMQARQAAARAQCVGNVKRLGFAEIMYAADNDDRFPPAKRWLDAPASQLAAERIDTCPAVRAKGGEYGYAFATALGSKKQSDIMVPANEILLYETSNLVRNANGDPVKEPPTNRHGQGRTLDYADGHARWERSRRAPSE